MVVLFYKKNDLMWFNAQNAPQLSFLLQELLRVARRGRGGGSVGRSGLRTRTKEWFRVQGLGFRVGFRGLLRREKLTLTCLSPLRPGSLKTGGFEVPYTI